MGGKKVVVMKWFYLGTNISFEIAVAMIDFLGKEWIFNPHFLENCVLAFDNNSVFTKFVFYAHI